jgi:hypothetical protein
MECTLLLGGGSGQEHVEDVIVSLALGLENDPRLLQQI